MPATTNGHLPFPLLSPLLSPLPPARFSPRTSIFPRTLYNYLGKGTGTVDGGTGEEEPLFFVSFFLFFFYSWVKTRKIVDRGSEGRGDEAFVPRS